MLNHTALRPLSTTGTEKMAMTFYEHTATIPQAQGLIDAILNRLLIGTKKVQYSRMMSALLSLTDDQLTAIGITRKQIPAHARICVYGE